MSMAVDAGEHTQRSAMSFSAMGLAVAVLAVVLWAFEDTALSMAAIWARSDTFMHGALVPGLVLWLMWRSRKRLAKVPIAAAPGLLLVVAAACLAWLLGQLASVQAVSQLALVTVIVASVPALVGWQVARAWMFPLAFLYFAVPIGEFAVPWLMTRTADATAFALSAVGIPVYREGLELIIPSGHWSVVEACSGLRYLVASFMVGTLYAYLTYSKLHKRLMFVAASLAVPIFANWARAFLTVLLGHVSGNELATGVDHLIYGWVFFGLIIGLMFWVGLRWADNPTESNTKHDSLGPALASTPVTWLSPARLATSMALLGLVVGSQFIWRDMQRLPSAPLPALTLPSSAEGWTAVADPAMPWAPGYRDPSSAAIATYERGGHPVWTWVGYYRQPGGRGKLVSSSNAVSPLDEKSWAVYENESQGAFGIVPAVRALSMRQGAAMGIASAARVRVWMVFWVDGHWTASPAFAKALQARSQLMGRSGDGAVVVVATPMREKADEHLRQWSKLHLEAVAARLEVLRASSLSKSQP